MKEKSTNNKLRRLVQAGLLLGLSTPAVFTGCSSVAFHEKGRLQDPVMAFDASAAETHFYQKVYYSREGSVGGFGSTAGGGCGCY